MMDDKRACGEGGGEGGGDTSGVLHLITQPDAHHVFMKRNEIEKKAADRDALGARDFGIHQI